MEVYTPIYHITHINNLPSLLDVGYVWCDAQCIARGYKPVNIAYNHIKQRRFTTTVPAAKGGTLANYVPFYFCTRSPMLYAIHTKSVPEYQDSQEDIVYLALSANKIANELQNAWCFTDGHAVEALTDFYTSLDQLDQIDWKLIDQWSWKNTLEDNDRKRRKQAEFLVYQSVPLSWVEELCVFGNAQKTVVESLLQNKSISLPVSIKRNWYY
jgi:hypothetical protein